jgi:ornithine cyclodeaminase/alanine dehydrogenase-like protein (mu-crystallin family)
MTLILENEDVERVLTMRDSVAALEVAFRDYHDGLAVNRPRSHTYTDLGEGEHYLFKSMDGSLPRFRVHALRLSSDRVREIATPGGRRREKVAAAPGGRYVGLVLLFDLENLVPLAIIQDGFLQRTRVGATSALAARYLANPGARTVGLIGSGWQAGAQLLGLNEVFPIETYRAFSTNAPRLHAFCREQSRLLGREVTPAASAREAVRGADIVALATNSQDPVIAAEWLEPGQHVGSIQGHELDWATLERADLIGVRSQEEATFHHAPGHAPVEAAERKRLPQGLATKVFELGAIVAGQAGRRSSQEITLFTGGGTGASSGLGIQFAAVAFAAYRAAREAGLGRQVPTEWFTETAKP